jgi:outer membrane lipoprotein-sorting protein
MKQLMLLAFTLVFAFAQAQTADEVVNKYLTAAGGKDKLETVTSLQYTQKANFNTQMGAMEISMNFIRVDKKLFRADLSSEMLGNSFTVVTDTSGWVYIPANPFSVSEATLQKMKPEDRTPLATQMTSDGFFPELVNYATKGYTAELSGEGKSNGKACHKLKLKKDADERLYMIDKQTGYVVSMTIKGAAALVMSGIGATGMVKGSRVEKAEFTFHYSDYKDVSGIKVPGKMKLDLPMGNIEFTITDVKVNQSVDAKYYQPQ